MPSTPTRRSFLSAAGAALAAPAAAQVTTDWPPPGDRPTQDPAVEVLNPRARVPLSFIIDDSTCLVNLNKFASPVFYDAFAGSGRRRDPWEEWPVEIPDDFVRKFVDWCGENGVKGKYSVVPYPACVGRVDRLLPGWTWKELDESLKLVRERVTPDWDIHPEMATHTIAIELKTGQPYADRSPDHMENWGFSVGMSADAMAEYMAYSLQMLHNVDLPCEGVTTPGGFGSRARTQLGKATLDACRGVYRAEIPHYFRDLFADGDRSVAPRIEYASGLDTDDPRCVVSIIGCTGDWTGGWNCSDHGFPDRFITPDLSQGRMVDVIERGEPGCIVCHWTGIYFNGEEIGFKVFQEAVRRMHAKYDHLQWLKLSEISRYWAAKELTAIARTATGASFRAPFACPAFTVRLAGAPSAAPRLKVAGGEGVPLREVRGKLALEPGCWTQDGEAVVACFDLAKGASELVVG